MTELQLRGFDLAYREHGGGDGLPLVWGHGLTGSMGMSAAFPLIDLGEAAKHRRVVRYDAHGHGLSSVLVDPRRGSWAELALDQVALIDALGLDRVAVGGVSMGVGTALHAAAHLGDRLDRLVLVIPPTGWEERAPQVGQYEKMAGLVEARGTHALVDAFAKLPPPDPFAGSSLWADRRAATIGAADPARLAACFRGAAHADLPSLEALAELVVPTLVLAWSGDPSHPVSTAKRLGETLPDVEVQIAGTFEEFMTWSDRVTEFLA